MLELMRNIAAETVAQRKADKKKQKADAEASSAARERERCVEAVQTFLDARDKGAIAPRVIEALTKEHEHPGAWMPELRGLQEDGVLDAFLDACEGSLAASDGNALAGRETDSGGDRKPAPSAEDANANQTVEQQLTAMTEALGKERAVGYASRAAKIRSPGQSEGQSGMVTVTKDGLALSVSVDELEGDVLHRFEGIASWEEHEGGPLRIQLKNGGTVEVETEGDNATQLAKELAAAAAAAAKAAAAASLPD